jgi:hypothetical protein
MVSDTIPSFVLVWKSKAFKFKSSKVMQDIQILMHNHIPSLHANMYYVRNLQIRSKIYINWLNYTILSANNMLKCHEKKSMK